MNSLSAFRGGSLLDASITGRSDFNHAVDQVIVTTMNDQRHCALSSTGIATIPATTAHAKPPGVKRFN
jgi:hypothetical protein